MLSCLARQVELTPGYTLRSFFMMLETYDALVHLNAFFPDMLDQFHRGPDEPRLEIYRSFTGQCEGKSVQIKDFQVDMLLDMQVRLGKLKHVIFGDQVDVFEFDTVFTLFELVEGIGWELGFHGTPRECQIGNAR
jgi:hypothetical protein